jgi:hypothetical protein
MHVPATRAAAAGAWAGGTAWAGSIRTDRFVTGTDNVPPAASRGCEAQR